MKIVMDKSLALIRNIDGYNFIFKMREEEKDELINKLEPIIFSLGYKKIDLEKLSSIEKLQYVERNILSSKFLESKSSRYYTLENKYNTDGCLKYVELFHILFNCINFERLFILLFFLYFIY